MQQGGSIIKGHSKEKGGLLTLKCKFCGKEFSEWDDFMMMNYNKHLRTHGVWRDSIDMG